MLPSQHTTASGTAVSFDRSSLISTSKFILTKLSIVLQMRCVALREHGIFQEVIRFALPVVSTEEATTLFSKRLPYFSPSSFHHFGFCRFFWKRKENKQL